MCIVTYRPEFAPPWGKFANVVPLSLTRLSRRNCQAIVDALAFGGRALPPEIAEDIVRKSDGLPLFVEELTGSVIEAANLNDDGLVQVPSTLRDSLSARLDRLNSAKEVAQIAAAFGREFSLDLVAATLGRSEAELEKDLDRLMAIEIIFQASRTERRFVFRHALVQHAAYESMLKSKRREIHAHIVRIIKQLRPDATETEPEVLATHLTRAELYDEAAALWRKAGRMALDKSAYKEAIGALRNALEVAAKGSDTPGHRIEAKRAIAGAYFASGELEPVQIHLEQAAEDASAIGDQVLVAEIAIQQCHGLAMCGGLTQSRAAAERALQIAGELANDGLAFGARFALGSVCSLAGEFRAAIELLRANLPENLKDPQWEREFGVVGPAMINSMSTLGECHGYLGEFDRAFELHDRAKALSISGPFNAYDRAVAHGVPIRTLLQRGDLAAALTAIRENRDFALKWAVRPVLSIMTGVLGYARALDGEVEEGIALLREGLDACRATQQFYIETGFLWYLAECLLPLDRIGAREAAEKALRFSREYGYRSLEAESLRVLAAVLAQSDTDLDQAERQAEAGLGLARRLGMRPEEAHALRVTGDIQRRRGNTGAARESRDGALAIYRDLKMDRWLTQMGGNGTQL